MSYPKINFAKAVDNHTLLIEFDNFVKKIYDVKPLLNKEMFYPLRNAAFFQNVQVEKSGYAVFWNDEIDISEYELWTRGKPLTDKSLC